MMTFKRLLLPALLLLLNESAFATTPKNACVSAITGGVTASRITAPVILETEVVTSPPVPSIFALRTKISGIQLEVDRASEEIKDRKHSNYKKESLRLLNMLAQTLFLTADSKLTHEKGELYLAEPLKDGYSMEFSYEGDKRSGSAVYHLRKIILVKPNGDTLTVDNSPVDDSATDFARSTHLMTVRKKAQGTETKVFTTLTAKDLVAKNPALDAFFKSREEENTSDLLKLLAEAAPLLSPQDQETTAKLKDSVQRVSVPVVISGPLLDDLIKWGNRLKFLKRSEFQNALATKKLGKVAFTARHRSTTQFMLEIVRKQTFKYALLLSVFAAVNQGVDVAKSSYDTWNAEHKEPAVASAPVSVEGAAALRALVHSFEPDPSKAKPLAISIGERTQPGLVQNRAAELAQLETQVRELESREARLGGVSRYYLGDAKLQFLQTKSFPVSGNANVASPSDSIVVISVFDKSGKIILNAFTSKSDELLPATSSLVIDKSTQPALYERILNRVGDQNPKP